MLNDVFDHVEKLVEKDGKNADVGLSIDGMGISKGREWNKHEGNDPDEIASDALNFLLVGLRKHWKYPAGYVFSNKINAKNLSCLIGKCLQLGIAHKLRIRTVTMDGTSTNFSCMKRFGCNLDGKGGVYLCSFI